MKGIQNTTTQNFSDLIGKSRKYFVPKFQRDYSWDLEQWDDLWQDILIMTSEEGGDHYLGYLVLQTNDNKNYYIIDGQQRITTISILILVLIKYIKNMVVTANDENDRRVSSLLSRYIGTVDPVSLDYDNYLILNRNNDAYYKDYLVKLGNIRLSNYTATEKLMKRCFEWFENAAEGKFASGKECAAFIEKVLDNLFFTTIEVNDELNAFRVFETLNARGVQLSSADLLKNYLFSLVDERTNHIEHIASLESKWAKLTQNIGAEKLPDFVRYYWNASNKTVRSAELFKAVRKAIKDNVQVFALVNELISYSEVYKALRDADSPYWENDGQIKEYITLFNLFNLRQGLSLLMVAELKLSREDFKKVFKKCIVTSFRYNVIAGKNPNEIDAVYNEMAMGISKNGKVDESGFQKIYVEDSEFAMLFASKAFLPTARNTKIVRYILCKLDEAGLPFDIGDNRLSIEHIMPQSLNGEWNVEPEIHERNVYRLGNLCLMERTLNKEAENLSFCDKRKVYEKSEYADCKSIAADYEDWTERSIADRQRKMARKAKSVWKLN